MIYTKYLAVSKSFHTVNVGQRCIHSTMGMGILHAVNPEGRISWSPIHHYDTSNPVEGAREIHFVDHHKFDNLQPVSMFIVTDEIDEGDWIVQPNPQGFNVMPFPTCQYKATANDIKNLKNKDILVFKVLGEVDYFAAKNLREGQKFSKDDIQVEGSYLDKRNKFLIEGDEVQVKDYPGAKPHEIVTGEIKEFRPLEKDAWDWKDEVVLTNVYIRELGVEDTRNEGVIPAGFKRLNDYTTTRDQVNFAPIPWNTAKVRCSMGCFH